MPDYIDKTVAAYDNSPQKFEVSTKDMVLLPEIKKLVSLLPPTDLSILDAGCGYGRDLEQFKQLGVEAVGIDMSEALLARGRELHPDYSFQKMDVRSVAFSAGSFRGLWCNAVLLHLDDKDIEAALREFHRVLCGKGALLISFKKGAGTQEIVESFSSNDNRFYNYKTIETANKLLEDAGFEVKDSYYVNERERFGEHKRDLDWVYCFSIKA